MNYSTADTKESRTLGKDSKMRDMGVFGSGGSAAADINNQGTIVGYIIPKGGGFAGHNRGFLYRNGTFTALPYLRKDPDSSAEGINDAGQIVGVSGSNATLKYHAVLWSADGATITDLGCLPGGRSSGAQSISNDGRIVGGSDTHSGGNHAVLFSHGTIQDLGTLGGKGSGATCISADGKYIVGYSSPASGRQHACLWEKGNIVDLGVLGSAQSAYSSAQGVNNTRQVVGHSTTGANNDRAFLWEAGKIVDLNQLIPANSGWKLEIANSINNQGSIVGIGTHNGQSHAFLLIPSQSAAKQKARPIKPT